jgi:hypothetical protein
MEIHEERLASLAATDTETVQNLIELGLLPSEGPFERSLVPRVRFLVRLRDAGVPLGPSWRKPWTKAFSPSRTSRKRFRAPSP